jgi:large subunit ribosomal protein L18
MAYKFKLSPQQRIKLRIRKKVLGTPARPRLVVYRSLKNIYAQLIDDLNRKTITSVSSLHKEVKDNSKQTTESKLSSKISQCKIVGKLLAEKALQQNITKAVFDRHGYLYHGRVKAVADGAREGGLKF